MVLVGWLCEVTGDFVTAVAVEPHAVVEGMNVGKDDQACLCSGGKDF